MGVLQEHKIDDKTQDKILKYWNIVLTIILVIYYIVYVFGGGG